MKQQRKPTSKESSRSDPSASRSLRSSCNAAQDEGRWVATVVSDALGSITNACRLQTEWPVVYKQPADWGCEQACFVAHRQSQCVVMTA
jgi:hypothetical protein